MSITSAKSGATGISLALDNNYMEPIATTVVGSGGVNSIVFNDVPQGYKHLQVRGISRGNINGSASTFGLVLQLNSDTSTTYTSHVLFGNGSSAGAGAATSQTGLSVVNVPGSAATSNAFGCFVVDILDYSNTNKYKTVRGIGGYDGNDTNGIVAFRSGVWMDNSSVVSLTFTRPSDNFAQYSRFSLYGIRG